MQLEKIITNHSIVILHISIKLEDASVADSTKVNATPAQIRMGKGDVSERFESQLLGLKIDEVKSFILSPQDAYGYANPANIHRMPRSRFAETIKLEKGIIIEFSHLNGTAMPGIIRDFDDETVTIDFNHPLCGHTLQFEVEIIDIQ